MRLSDSEVVKIKQVLASFINVNEPKVYLYGSRTDDTLKGGDIDLLWIVPDDLEKSLNIDKYIILTALKKEIGDQRIDLGIVSQPSLEADSFYNQVLEQAVQL